MLDLKSENLDWLHKLSRPIGRRVEKPSWNLSSQAISARSDEFELELDLNTTRAYSPGSSLLEVAGKRRTHKAIYKGGKAFCGWRHSKAVCSVLGRQPGICRGPVPLPAWKAFQSFRIYAGDQGWHCPLLQSASSPQQRIILLGIELKAWLSTKAKHWSIAWHILTWTLCGQTWLTGLKSIAGIRLDIIAKGVAGTGVGPRWKTAS